MEIRRVTLFFGAMAAILLSTGCSTVPTASDDNADDPGDRGTGPVDPIDDTSTADGNIGIVVRADPPAIKADGEDLARIEVTIREWSPDQDRQSEEPTGAPLPGVPVEVTTSVGVFQDTGDIIHQTESNGHGEVVLALTGQIPGMATVTVRAGSELDVARTIRVPIAKIILSPSDVEINLNEHVFFECTVEGPDDPDQLYYVWNGIGGFLQPQGSETYYSLNTPDPSVRIIETPTLEWFRWSGQQRDGYLEVEAFLREPGQTDVSLGTARASIFAAEYTVPCILGGRVERGESSCGVRYGYLIPFIDEAAGYGVHGEGFNDPLYYGDSYSGGIILNSGGYSTEPGGYFVGLTSGGSNSPCEGSDEELIADFAARFEGGVFEARPLFGNAGMN